MIIFFVSTFSSGSLISNTLRSAQILKITFTFQDISSVLIVYVERSLG